jgi:hypothetical protein
MTMGDRIKTRQQLLDEQTDATNLAQHPATTDTMRALALTAHMTAPQSTRTRRIRRSSATRMRCGRNWRRCASGWP